MEGLIRLLIFYLYKYPVEMKVDYNIRSYRNRYNSNRKSGFVPVWIALLIILINSCTKAGEFNTGTEFVESQTSIKILDTFKIDLSTVLLDSLWTSGTGMAFVGSYTDQDLGEIISSSFFELGFPTIGNLEETAIFDSAAFIFSYTGDSYGDTTALMSVSIHQIKESLSLDESGYLYNNSIVPYESGIIATKTFTPKPNSPDTLLSIAANDFGNKIFDLVQEGDEIVSTSEQFLGYLKGFVLTSEPGKNSAIIGLTADDPHISFKIYYHVDGTVPEPGVITIPYGSSDVQFNQIKCDFNNPLLKKIRESNNVVRSSDIGDNAYLHGLIGLLPEIQFPYLQDLLLENRWKILNAEIIFEPVKGTYDNSQLPEMLYLYDTDKSNEIKSQLFSTGETALTSNLSVDELFNEDTRYTFDITSFINAEISDSYFDYDHGLLIGLKGTDLISTFGRMIIEGKNPTVKLRLYYLTY